MGRPQDILIRTNKVLDQILEVDNGSNHHILRCIAVMLISIRSFQILVSYKIVFSFTLQPF
jgi:hypothetical protein